MTPPNDWRINKCLALSGSLLVAMLGLIGLAALGYDIPVLRQFVGFLLLTFAPGILLLRILRIHDINITESLLYLAGLSLIFDIATGIVTNFIPPLLGISHPFTIAPLTITFTIFLITLAFVAYWRDKDFQPTPIIRTTTESTKSGFWAKINSYLLATLLPLLAILGTSFMNVYQNNMMLIALIFIIALIIGLVAFNKLILPEVYPFMIFMAAIALLYQTTLISANLVGSDVHIEYYISKLVLDNSFWDTTVGLTVNSCLSLVMLAPVYSLMLNIDIVWLLKIVYPFLFALLPVALFRIFRLQFGPRYAFIATIFFISMPMFTMDMVQLNRQQISELFFGLVILLMVDRKLTPVQRITLVIIFGFGVIVSYYGMGTGYIGYLIFGVLMLVFLKSRFGRTVWQWLIGKRNPLPPDLESPGAFNWWTLIIITAVSLAFMFAYYNMVASRTAMSGPEAALSGISFVVPPAIGLREPLLQTAIGLDFISASIGGKVWRVFQYLVELCLIIGFIRLIFRPATLGPKLKAEYVSFTIVSIVILLGLFVLPIRSYGLGASRIWQITLLLVSPLFIFGAEMIGLGMVGLSSLFRKGSASLKLSLYNPALIWFPVIVILIPYFIFNSGFVFELSRSKTTNFIDLPYSLSLSNYRTDISTAFTRQDVNAADWLFKVQDEKYGMTADYQGAKIFWHHGLWSDSMRWQGFIYIKDDCTSKWNEYLLNIACDNWTTTLSRNPKYIYLRTWNMQNEMLTVSSKYAVRESLKFNEITGFVQAMWKGNIVYNNNSARIVMYDKHN